MEQYPLWNGGNWERPQSAPPALPVFPKRKPRRSARTSRNIRRGLKGFALFLSTITLLTVVAACVARFGLPQALLALLPQEGQTGELDPSFGFHFQEDDQTSDRPTTIRRAPTGGSARMELLAQEGPVLTRKEIYDKSIPSIVYIQARSGNMVSSGTGIVLSEDGYIITNEHVISGSSSVTVLFHDNTSLPALLVGYYAKMDLAVLKVEAGGLTPAEFGDSSQMREGDEVVAIGNPLGIALQWSMTSGIVSAINRSVRVDGETRTMIQTDAPLNPGNSGGALINDRGQVIGITTLKMMSSEETIEGLGFAIPTREAKEIVDQLVAKGMVMMFGFTVSVDSSVIARYGGLYVVSVDEKSDAYAKGLRPGDVIVTANGEPADSAVLAAAKLEMEPGDAIRFTVRRGERQLELEICLVEAELLS